MQAVIMAGGYGTRLRPLTNVIPKPMVPIIDQPVIEYIVKHLKKYGFDFIYKSFLFIIDMAAPLYHALL